MHCIIPCISCEWTKEGFADLGSGSVDSVSVTCFYNCQQKQNVTRSWHKWTIFGFSSRGRQFETILERCLLSSRCHLLCVLALCETTPLSNSTYNFLFSFPFAPHFLPFLLSHILLCLHFKRDWIHQQTEVRNNVHGSRTHGLNLCHLTTHHCSQTRKVC